MGVTAINSSRRSGRPEVADHGERPVFTVLGEVAFTLGDRHVRLRSVKKRLILALLLCHSPAVLSPDRLIDALWGENPPATARQNLRVYVYKLRQALGHRHGVEYEDGGYRLRLAPAQLDAGRFECLADRGGEAAAAGDVAAAAAYFQQALEVWSADAYGDLADHPMVREEACRLNERRAVVLEARIDADLAQGAHSQLVPELTKLVAELPYREGLRAQLMLALYRSGRRAESLEVFRTSDRMLSEELGISAGSRLQALHAAILRDDPHLQPRRSFSSPHELPPAPTDFTGRRDEVKRLFRVLTTGPARTAVISGPGGTGKSALAVHVAHRMLGRYPDGQVYVDLCGTLPGGKALTAAEALGRILRSLNDGSAVPADEGECAARYRSLTSGRRLLIVLDNALDAAQVRPLLPGDTGCAVIVTSRRPLSSLNVAHVSIGDLPRDEATALFRRLVGAQRADAHPQEAERIITWCGRLPLAICVAGARLAARPTWTVADLAGRLAAEENRLFELHDDDRRVSASIDVGYQALDEAQARVFRLVSLLDGTDIGGAAASALANLPEWRTVRLLDDLADAQLLRAQSLGRFQLPDLVRLFARERALLEDGPEVRREAVRRGLHFYLATARAAARLTSPGTTCRIESGPRVLRHPGRKLTGRADVHAWAEAEAACLVAAVRQAAASGMEDVAAGLAGCLFPPFHGRGRWRELHLICELGAEAAERLGEPRALASAYGDLGHVLTDQGRLPEAAAHVTHSLKLYREIGGTREEAAQLDRLGVIHSRLGRTDTAIGHLRHALSLTIEREGRAERASVLNNLGLAYRGAGAFDRAVEAHTGSIELCREIGDLAGEARALGDVAEALRRSGRPGEGLAHCREALEADRAAQNLGGYAEAAHLWGLGDIERDLGEHAAARLHWRASAALLLELRLISAEEKAAIDVSAGPGAPRVLWRGPLRGCP